MTAPALLALALLAGAPARDRGTAAAAPAAAAPSGPEERERAAIAEEMVRLGAQLERELARRDVDALVARLPAAGLRCGDRTVPRARVERDLRTPGAWLHDVLLGEAAARPGAPASLRAFLAAAREIAVLVAFARDPRAGPVGRPCLDFRAPELVNPARPFCFEREGGRWVFTQSLYPCG